MEPPVLHGFSISTPVAVTANTQHEELTYLHTCALGSVWNLQLMASSHLRGFLVCFSSAFQLWTITFISAFKKEIKRLGVAVDKKKT